MNSLSMVESKKKITVEEMLVISNKLGLILGISGLIVGILVQNNWMLIGELSWLFQLSH